MSEPRTGDAGPASDGRPPWVGDVLAGAWPSPTVVILGGFLTSPLLYRALAARLRARGVADVVVANVWAMDWVIAARRGMGPILTRSGRALLAGSARSALTGRGAPVLVVGHSAGGVVARLLTSPEPFMGRRLNASGRIGAIVTLGSPHVVSVHARLGRRLGAHAATFANEHVPGPWFAPRVGYLAVASRAVVGRPGGTPRERRTWRVYQDLLADPSADEDPGDGLIPVASALPPGMPSLILDDAHHGQWPGREWYGSDRFVDAWWPVAVDAWRGGLLARARASTPVDDGLAGRADERRAQAPAPAAAFDGSGDRR